MILHPFWLGVLVLVAGGTRSANAQPAPARPEPIEVTVTAGRPPLVHARQAPSVASTVIDGSALRGAGATSAEVLSRVPGIQVNRSGAESDLSTASIRGADSRQTPVYLAGVRLNDDVTGSADLSTIPLWMIERVEVYRGNAPEQADRQGMGGAVFFQPRLPQKARTGALLEVGSYGERALGLAHENGGEQGGVLLSFRRWQASNDYPYLNDFGQRFDAQEVEEPRVNADFSAQDAWAIGRYRLGKGGHVTAILNAFNREQGVSGLSIIPAQEARAQTRRVLGGVSSRVPCAGNASECTVELSTMALSASSTFLDPFAELPGVAGPQVVNLGRRLIQQAKVEAALGESASFKFSASQAFETLHIDQSEVASRRGKRLSTQGSGVLNLQIGKALSLHTLLTAECHTTVASNSGLGGSSDQHSDVCAALAPSGRLGAVLRLSDAVSLLGNGGRSLRVPTLGELYGVSPAVSGNATLQPENGYSTDLGVRALVPLAPQRRVLLAIDGFVFSRWVNQMIRYRRVNTGAIAPFNVADARVLGAELAMALDFRGYLRAETAMTLLDPRETTRDPALDPTRNDLLPLTSRFVSSSWIEGYIEPESHAVKRAALGVRHQYRASRYEDPAGLSVLPAQSFFDLEASCALYGGMLGLRGALRNVFDSRTVDLIGLPLPGRTFHLLGEVWL